MLARFFFIKHQKKKLTKPSEQMNSEIDNALNSLREEDDINPRPQKRLKMNALPVINDKLLVKRKQLKRLLLRHKGIDLSEPIQIQEQIEELTESQIDALIENINLQTSKTSPTNNAESFIGLLGILLQKYTGSQDIYHRLIGDEKLIALVDHYVPNIAEQFSIPMQIGHLVAEHYLNDVQKNAYNNTRKEKMEEKKEPQIQEKKKKERTVTPIPEEKKKERSSEESCSSE